AADDEPAFRRSPLAFPSFVVMIAWSFALIGSAPPSAGGGAPCGNDTEPVETRPRPETAAVVSKSTKTESGADTVTPGGGAPATEDRPAKVVPPAAETASNVAWAANVRVVCARLSQYEDGPLATVTIAPSAVRIDAKAFRPNTPAGAAGNARPAVPSNVKTPSGGGTRTDAAIRP